MATDGARREEILETAADLFGSSGLRTSLREISDACGILPGSLYHHFDSKDAILVELVERYRADLDSVTKEALDSLHALEPHAVEDRVVEFGRAIAACAVRHRAALLLTLYDPPKVAGEELIEAALHAPTGIDAVMLQILEEGASDGSFRPEVDLALLGERICQSMLHVGVGTFHRSSGANDLPAMKCRVFLHGVAARPPSRSALDRSAAMRAAREVAATWGDVESDERVAHLQAAARAEFARRGYEATTVRDISAAAGLSTAAVYRLFSSKEELLASIMHGFVDNVTCGWDAVAESVSTPLEQLDALMWVNASLLERFGDEFKIQFSLLRQTPPSSLKLGPAFTKQQRQMKDLLEDGIAAGEMHLDGGSVRARVFSMLEIVWTPPGIVERAGVDAAHALARETVLMGAATRS